MKISFAARRPEGSYALAIPVWSQDIVSDRLAALDEGARILAARGGGGAALRARSCSDRRDLHQ
jgi:hypothetical protein